MKKDKEILRKLKSSNEKLISETIIELRDTGHVGYLDDIFKAYQKGFNEETKTIYAKFISDIKSKDASNYIANFISDLTDENDIALYTSSCWQSSLDFANNINLFTDLFIKYNYQVAIEAFTVIENCMHNIDQELIKDQIDKLKKSLSTIQEEKKLLMAELIKVFQSFLI